MRIFGGDEFALIIISFVANRVPAFVAVKVEVTLVGHSLPKRLAQCLMIVVRGANEAIEADTQLAVELDERLHRAIDIGTRLHAGSAGRLGDFQAVLIGASQEMHIIAIETLEARNRIAGDRLIGMAHMWPSIGVGDGGGQVKSLAHDASECGKACRSATGRGKNRTVHRPASAATLTPRSNATCAGSSESATAPPARSVLASQSASA